jgi:hypothetical protein
MILTASPEAYNVKELPDTGKRANPRNVMNAGCNWKVRTNFGHCFHYRNKEKCPYQRESGNISFVSYS